MNCMQIAEFAHDLGARAQHQVEGVAEHDLGADLLQVARHHALTVP
jgi:hypothetical protein